MHKIIIIIKMNTRDTGMGGGLGTGDMEQSTPHRNAASVCVWVL